MSRRATPRRPWIGTVTACALAAVVLAALVVGTPADPPPAPLAAAQPCRPVTVVVAAGRGPGSTTLDAVTDPIATSRADRVAVLRVPPPADASTPAVTRATESLAGSVATVASTCPQSRFVLLGWSEGARAAGDLAAGIGAGRERRVPAARVLAVGLFGDPARAPAGRTVPARVGGGGVFPPRDGFGALEGRTIEICAPDDAVCASPRPADAPDALMRAAAAPAHAAYPRLPVAPGLTATDWATRSLTRLIDAAQPPAPTSPPDTARPSTSARPSGTPGTTGRPSTTRTPSTPGSPRTPGTPGSSSTRSGAGLLLDSTVGDLAGHFDNSGNRGLVEGGERPRVVRDPLDPVRQAFAFTVPGGAKRSEVLPKGAQDFREGDHVFFGYVGSLADGFPVDNANAFQVIMQLHDGGTNVSPPVALEIKKGQLWLTASGSGPSDRPLGPVATGRRFAVQLEVAFARGGGAVSVWRDGRQVLDRWRPPKGTMIDDHDYLKVGLYRSGSISDDGTVFLHELKIGDDLAGVQPASGGAATG